MVLQILIYISIFFLAFFLGFATCVLTTPILGTLAIDYSKEKDVYTMLFNDDPEELNLKQGQYLFLKVRYLNRNKNTSSNGK